MTGRGRGGKSRRPRGALCYQPGAEAVRSGGGGRFPQLRPAARPGRCGDGGGGESRHPAPLGSAQPRRREESARRPGAAGPRAEMALPRGRRRPRNPRVSRRGRPLLSRPRAEEDAGRLTAEEAPALAPCKPLLALTSGRAEGAGGGGGGGGVAAAPSAPGALRLRRAAWSGAERVGALRGGPLSRAVAPARERGA